MTSSNYKRAIIGFILVFIGGIFLLDNLGFDIDIPYYLFSWPAIFVVFGVINLLSGNGRASLMFFSLGAAFYLHYYNVLRIGQIWPVILIFIGLSFILRRKSAPRKISESGDKYFDEVAIFGGTERKYISEDLQGGKITCVFGGSEIDLRGSKAQDGAVIEIFCMFGGVELMVPEDWKINMDATAIFGGFSDSRKNVTSATTTTVHIKGFTMFGGGEIKN
ncbi:LiaF transmembrane domain-containing protein [Ekhidna sp. To15]|uniref:LiaF transmembrane domain-containing protein n=1 Tax=Ekhidna sp. To15 TaxID=3395267 RepID=UPI003F520243